MSAPLSRAVRAGLATSVGTGLAALAAFGASAATSMPAASRTTHQHAATASKPFSIGRPVPLVVKVPHSRTAASYVPAQFQGAYDLAPLYAQGDNGKGSTILVIDSFGSKTIKSDLAKFDSQFKLAAPPSFKIITPAGKVTGSNGSWALETSLDVEYAHAIAPGANIILAETPVAETEGAVGFKQIVTAENYVIKHEAALGITGGLVITQSFGATEQTFGSGFATKIAAFRSAFTAAQAANVTVLAASGDLGATDCSNPTCSSHYNFKVNSWPSSDPLVTSVGGLNLSISGAPYHLTGATVWNEPFVGAGGGGDSAAFKIPSFQSSVAGVVGQWRGTPDVSMSASVSGGAVVILGGQAQSVGGTSEACPEFAGIVAIADQVAGKGLGDLNAALYAMESAGAAGIVDVTKGNNSFDNVTGYSALKGYDMASGIGTVDAAKFVPELVAAVAQVG